MLLLLLLLSSVSSASFIASPEHDLVQSYEAAYQRALSSTPHQAQAQASEATIHALGTLGTLGPETATTQASDAALAEQDVLRRTSTHPLRRPILVPATAAPLAPLRLAPPQWPYEYFLLAPLLQRAADDLERRGFVVIDGLLGDAAARRVRQEAAALRRLGFFGAGTTNGDGALNRSAFSNYRSDRIAWEDQWSAAPEVRATLTGLHGLLAHLELVGRLLSAELGGKWGLDSRTRAMLSVYGKDGTSYGPHFDNHGRNPRMVTAIYYFNPRDWRGAVDGGQLRVEARSRRRGRGGRPKRRERRQGEAGGTVGGTEAGTGRTAEEDVRGTTRSMDGGDGVDRDGRDGRNGSEVAAIDPLLDRLVLFDSNRVRHEVTKTFRDRFALTVWFTRKDMDATPANHPGKCVACHDLFGSAPPSSSPSSPLSSPVASSPASVERAVPTGDVPMGGVPTDVLPTRVLPTAPT